jgi:hypothetical protein
VSDSDQATTSPGTFSVRSRIDVEMGGRRWAEVEVRIESITVSIEAYRAALTAVADAVHAWTGPCSRFAPMTDYAARFYQIRIPKTDENGAARFWPSVAEEMRRAEEVASAELRGAGWREVRASIGGR